MIHQTEDLHGGKVNDSRFKKRMRGEGQLAEMIKQQIALARRQYFEGRSLPELNTALYLQMRDPQMKLF